ncbi:hypothetical protein T03_10286 [Trichinella britovi]|uniref:Uncharacterized protein n=1 Tax=Trichinella britovi TaxID=45882 RepID=A0A0V1CZ07_TRIBR|nr:hypothetical protein T03_10286 [Trichinella britovi]
MQPKKSGNEVNKKNIPTTVQLSSVINLLVQNVVQENDIIRSQRMHKQYTRCIQQPSIEAFINGNLILITHK